MQSTGTIYFDGGCGFCTAGTDVWRKWLGPRGFAFKSFYDAQDELAGHWTPGQPPTEMLYRDTSGAMHGGIDALGRIARHVWWMWPLWPLSRLPVTRQVMAFAYKQVAKRRQKISAVCGLRPLQTQAAPAPR